MVAAAREINESISAFLETCGDKDALNFSNPDVEELHKKITVHRARVEKLANKHGGSPADLPNPSFRAYCWMKFLSQKKQLLVHLHGQYDFLKVIRLQNSRNGFFTNPATIHLSIQNSGYLFRGQRKGRIFILEINEGFITADEEVKSALVQTAMGNKDSQLVKKIRQYSKSTAYKSISSALQKADHPNKLSARGETRNLEEIFRKVNKEYFQNELDLPRLLWSKRRSARRMGAYDPDSDTITLNNRLDSSDIPTLVVEYIMYHEMLHKKLGIRESNGRRYAHTAEFKKAEKRFKGKSSADRNIQKINRVAHR